MGAMLSGVAAAAGILGVTLGEVLTARDANVRTCLADDASTWPAEMQDAGRRRQPNAA